MHAILFGIKRAFHTSSSALRPLLLSFKLTPARFDLLYVVRERRLTWLSQARRMLGVTSATISRMLKSLVDLGLVKLSRPARDTRQREITLTPEGEVCMRRAIAALHDTGDIHFFVQTMFEPPWKDPVPKMLDFQTGLTQVRDACRDGATDPYPWHPDDELPLDPYEDYDRIVLGGRAPPFDRPAAEEAP